jgi:N-acetylneuraminate synthase
MTDIVIAGRKINREEPPYMIAELSGNHGGSLDRARRMLDAAKRGGADAAKLQTYTPDTMTIDHAGPGFDITEGLWANRRLYELYQEAHTPFEWHGPLFAHARDIGLTIFSTPFDRSAVELLEDLEAPAFKIASFEMVDTGLIARAAESGKPVIMSTGLCSLSDIEEAVAAVGSCPFMLLQCTSGYPTPVAQANLRRMDFLANHFGCSIGLSDHTKDVHVAAAAVARGAVVVEKHFTLDRNGIGSDNEFSLEPDEFKRLVDTCRDVHAALGAADFRQQESEQAAADHRRSLYVVADVGAGDVIGETDIRSIRPGFGLPPKHLSEVLGRRAARDLKRGEPLAWEMVEDVVGI